MKEPYVDMGASPIEITPEYQEMVKKIVEYTRVETERLLDEHFSSMGWMEPVAPKSNPRDRKRIFPLGGLK